MTRETRKEKTERRLPYFAYNVLFLVVIASFCCALQIPYFRFTPGSEVWNNPTLYFFLSIFAIASGIAFMLTGIKIFRVHVSLPPVLIFTVFAIGGIIAAFCHGDVFSFTARESTVVLEDYGYLIRIESALMSILMAFAVYLFFVFGPSTRLCKSSGFLLAEAAVILGLASIIYTLTVQWEVVVNLLEKGLPHGHINAFFGSKNVNAGYLLMSMFAEMFLLEIDGRRWRYLMIGLFGAAIVMTTSKAAIPIAAFVFVAFLIYRFVRSRKEGVFTWKTAIMPGIVITVAVVLISAIAIAKPKFFASVWESFLDFFDNSGRSTVSTRWAIWQSSWNLISESPVSLIFGQGDVIYPYLLSVAMDGPNIGTSHNFALEIMGRGGLLRLTLLVAFLVYLGIRSAKRIRHDFRNCFVSLLFAVGIFARQMLEHTFIFDFTATSCGYCYFIFMPLLSDNLQNVPEVSVPALKKNGSMSKYWAVVAALLAAIATAFIPRPYAWILPSALAACLLILWLVLILTKTRCPYLNENLAALLFALSFLCVLATLPIEVLMMTAIILAPPVAAYACLVTQLLLCNAYVCENDVFESFYLRVLAIEEKRRTQ